MVNNSFSRELRLLTPENFHSVFNNPVKAASPQLTLLARLNDHDHPRIGITLAKKRVRKAVNRNKLKRLFREHFRTNKDKLPNIDVVYIGKSGLDEMTNEEVVDLVKGLYRTLLRRCKKS